MRLHWNKHGHARIKLATIVPDTLVTGTRADLTVMVHLRERNECKVEHSYSVTTISTSLIKPAFNRSINSLTFLSGAAGLGAQLKVPEKEEWNKYDIPVFEKSFYRSGSPFRSTEGPRVLIPTVFADIHYDWTGAWRRRAAQGARGGDRDDGGAGPRLPEEVHPRRPLCITLCVCVGGGGGSARGGSARSAASALG